MEIEGIAEHVGRSSLAVCGILGKSIPASIEIQDTREIVAIVLVKLACVSGLLRILQPGFWITLTCKLHYWPFHE